MNALLNTQRRFDELIFEDHALECLEIFKKHAFYIKNFELGLQNKNINFQELLKLLRLMPKLKSMKILSAIADVDLSSEPPLILECLETVTVQNALPCVGKFLNFLPHNILKSVSLKTHIDDDDKFFANQTSITSLCIPKSFKNSKVFERMKLSSFAYEFHIEHIVFFEALDILERDEFVFLTNIFKNQLQLTELILYNSEKKLNGHWIGLPFETNDEMFAIICQMNSLEKLMMKFDGLSSGQVMQLYNLKKLKSLGFCCDHMNHVIYEFSTMSLATLEQLNFESISRNVAWQCIVDIARNCPCIKELRFGCWSSARLNFFFETFQNLESLHLCQNMSVSFPYVSDGKKYPKIRTISCKHGKPLGDFLKNLPNLQTFEGYCESFDSSTLQTLLLGCDKHLRKIKLSSLSHIIDMPEHKIEAIKLLADKLQILDLTFNVHSLEQLTLTDLFDDSLFKDKSYIKMKIELQNRTINLRTRNYNK